MTLVLYYAKKYKDNAFDIERLKYSDINGAFKWDEPGEEWDFWSNIYRKKYDEFYKKYTPEKLRKRLEE